MPDGSESGPFAAYSWGDLMAFVVMIRNGRNITTRSSRSPTSAP
jgi:hypothetical protein